MSVVRTALLRFCVSSYIEARPYADFTSLTVVLPTFSKKETSRFHSLLLQAYQCHAGGAEYKKDQLTIKPLPILVFLVHRLSTYENAKASNWHASVSRFASNLAQYPVKLRRLGSAQAVVPTSIRPFGPYLSPYIPNIDVLKGDYLKLLW